MNNNLVEINRIPRNTYKFLKVNSLSLMDVSIPKFNESPLKLMVDVSEYVSLRKITKGDLNLVNLNNNSNFLSQENLKEFYKEVNDGFYLEVEKNATINDVIKVDLDFSKNASSLIASNVIKMKKNSSATLIIKNSGRDDDYSFFLSNTNLIIEEGANLKIIRVQNLNESSVNIEGYNSTILENGKLDIVSVDLGGEKNIINIYNNLEGNNAEGNISSIYLGDKNKIIDINQYSRFKGSESKANIDNKGILLDKSKKTLRYTLDFLKDSKKSEGKEHEYVMLLTPNAQNSSVPILLAGEDDVKGEHGASVGRLDENTLFYLMSRGLSEKEARALIIKGSIASIIDELQNDDLKKLVLEEIDKRVMINE